MASRSRCTYALVPLYSINNELCKGGGTTYRRLERRTRMCHISLAHCCQSPELRPVHTCGSRSEAMASWYSPCLACYPSVKRWGQIGGLRQALTRYARFKFTDSLQLSALPGSVRAITRVSSISANWALPVTQTNHQHSRISRIDCGRTHHLPGHALHSVWAPLLRLGDSIGLGVRPYVVETRCLSNFFECCRQRLLLSIFN